MADDKKRKKEEDKVFDVAKPEATTPTTGSKPMVVGHKSLASDPTLREQPEKTDENSDESKKTAAHSNKITIKPLEESAENAKKTEGDGEKKDNEKKTVSEEPPATADAQAAADDKPQDTKATAASTDDSSQTTSESAVNDTSPTPAAETAKTAEANEGDDGTSKKTKPETAAQQEDKDAEAREKALQEMIASKDYVVPIKEKHGAGIVNFLVTLFVVACIGVLVGIVLIDAEIVRTTITLPFDLL